MSYSYEDECHTLFTPRGIKKLLNVRDRIDDLLQKSGACQSGKVIDGVAGDSFQMLACMDYLESIGEIKKISSDGALKYHVYVREESS